MIICASIVGVLFGVVMILFFYFKKKVAQVETKMRKTY